MLNKGWTIGIDLGATKIKAALVDSFGSIYNETLQPTNTDGGFLAIQLDLIAIIHKLQKLALSPVEAIGIGVPGQVDRINGIISLAPNLKWQNVPLKSDLQKILKLPITIDNDVRLAAYGEWCFGAGKGCDDIVCLFVGTGIGGGIISGGRLISGSQDAAGELGHTSISLNGPTCICGNKGCLEAYASGWAIAKRAKEYVGVKLTGAESLLIDANGDPNQITGKLVIQAAQNNNPLALKIMEEASLALVAGGINIANSLNPSRIIMGGGIIQSMPTFAKKMEEGIRNYALPAAKNAAVMISALKDNAIVIGAATLANERLKL